MPSSRAGLMAVAVLLAVALGSGGLLDLRHVPGAAGSAAGPDGEPGEGLAPARTGGGPGAYTRALAQAGAVPASPLWSRRGWEERGPSAIGGRLTDLALASDGTVFAAAASGGLWRSRDGGRTLDPAWPATATPAVGAVAVTAAGVVLAGTGEANAGGGSLTYGGDGVRRSVDGGTTWEDPLLAATGTVADIEAHPIDPDVAWLAAGGELFTGGGERGVYRTDDAGRTWQLVLPPDTPTTGGADIAVDPADPDHLLAATWDRQRTPDLRRYGGEGSGLHRSTDGGRTWQRVGGGLPGFTPDAGRIGVAFSPADPSRVYAVVTRGDGRAGGLWRSDDGGLAWQRVDDDPIYEPTQFIFAWWFGRVFPSPTDPDRVLVPGLSLLESIDGGVTFRSDARVHADQHDLVWDPADPSTAWLATDGGLYRSDEGGRSLTWQAATHQPVTQVYDVAVPPGAPDALVAGFQDIGCRTTPGPDEGWSAPTGGCGDGTAVLAHPDRPDEVVICGQYLRCRLSPDLGATTSRLATPVDDRFAWAAPIIRDPDDPDVLLAGGTRVHRSDDGGQTWAASSPDLTRGRSPDPDYPFGTVTALAAATDGELLAAGTDDGLVWRSDDAGVTWSRVLDQDRWITAIAVEGGDLLVATSGYRSGDGAPQVLRVGPSGAVEELGSGLPDAPVTDLAIVLDLHPDRGPGLVAATDVGVYAATDAAAPVWRRVGPADGSGPDPAPVPQVPVTSLDWLAGERQLTAGTYGRGVWRTGLPAITRHAGTDRYATAAAVARAGGDPADGTADGPTAGAAGQGGTVLLASGEDFPDALSAAAVAGRTAGATVVLTRPDALPEASRALLDELRPAELLVVGGPAAVGDAVVAQALAHAAPGATATRLAGPGRHATAAAVADRTHPDGAGTVVLATAGQPWDALAGAPYAAALGAPVLLVDADRLPAETAEALRRLAPTRLVALGGPAAIGETVLADAAALTGARADRVAGPTRTATASALTAALGPGESVWLASATAFPDALAAAATGAPVLLLAEGEVPAELLDALAGRGARRIRVAGGASAVLPATLDALVEGPSAP
jgi:putative cell wall-binding protein/photosystem II stability/assembly factor-like uncharacterized protein